MTRAVNSVVLEGLLGAALVALMVILFLRDWRSAIIVVVNIPLALMASVLALWLTGQTINLMTLGGLALAVGILVDESTVELENIHSQLSQGKTASQAVRDGAKLTLVPRFLAMLCILAVFTASLFMQGAARALFVPLSLAVGFAMIASYMLSSTLVPVLGVWLLKNKYLLPSPVLAGEGPGVRAELGNPLTSLYRSLLAPIIAARWFIVPIYLAIAVVAVWSLSGRLGESIFPTTNAGQFRLRMRAPDGTQIVRSEKYAKEALEEIKQELGPDNIDLTLGYVGLIHSNFPILGVFHWSRGPEEAILYVDLKDHFAISDNELKERLRKRLAEKMPDVRFSFEPSDIINEVMSFGSPTPVEVAVTGSSMPDNKAHAEKIRAELAKIPELRDLQFGQSLDYPSIQVTVNREKAGMMGLTPSDVSKSLVTATSSSRFVVPNYWADPKSGIAYQVQVEIPRQVLRAPYEVDTVRSVADLQNIPLRESNNSQILLRDVADVAPGTMPGQYDRYNMKRQLTLTANFSGNDLGLVSKQVSAAIERVGAPPKGCEVHLRGQIPIMREMRSGLTVGILLSIVAVFLLLTANFQSARLALASVATIPAVLLGSIVLLWLTGQTINIQSFIGTMMALGVAMANAILLITFAENESRNGATATDAASKGAVGRLRAIVMTTCAMIAGMIPMALGWDEAGQQNAPLGRAVIGGLLAGTFATLFLLPSIYALLRSKRTHSASLDPDDPNSPHFQAA